MLYTFFNSSNFELGRDTSEILNNKKMLGRDTAKNSANNYKYRSKTTF